MLRILNFGDIETGVWGAAWDLGADQPGFALIGDRASFAAPESALSDAWLLSGAGLELESVVEVDAVEGAESFDQLTAVRGHALIDGADHRIDCLGRRGVRAAFDPFAFESVRDVSAWFAPDDGLAVTAARPAKASGNQDDQLTASLFEAGHPLPVVEPRLSTSYNGDGSPTRAGLELWLEHPDDEETADDTVRYPRRAAGEAAGSPAATVAGSLAVEARLFRWHSHGHSGAGVYVLARSQ